MPKLLVSPAPQVSECAAMYPALRVHAPAVLAHGIQRYECQSANHRLSITQFGIAGEQFSAAHTLTTSERERPNESAMSV